MKNVLVKFSVAISAVAVVLSGCSVSSDEEPPIQKETSISFEHKDKKNADDEKQSGKQKETKKPSKKTKEPAPAKKKAPVKKSSAQKQLDKLKVAKESTAEYERSYFKHWTTVGNTGCDTRATVLKAESKKKVSVKNGCTVKTGSWVSSYDGVKFTNASKIDIDHMVPLNETWRSGAYKWDANTREAYANDLGYKNTLIAVSASSNRQKSDKDPSDWMPSQNKCQYVANWISVKTRWSLTVDKTEKSFLTKTVKGCKGLKVDSVKKAKIVKGSVPKSNNKDTSKSKDKSTSSKPKKTGSKTDPRYTTCTAAKKDGYGPYKKGKDPEYKWYTDRDKDGMACE